MGAFSDSYVLRVLLATPTRARNLDTVARQWHWLRTSVVDPYRSELYNLRGPGPKWRKKHGRCAGCYNPRVGRQRSWVDDEHGRAPAQAMRARPPLGAT
jgi:hypothetical protein